MKTVLVEFSGERFFVKERVKYASYLREGEFIVHEGELCKVLSAQANCPFIENLNKRFTAVLVSNGMGKQYHLRSVGQVRSYRKVRAA